MEILAKTAVEVGVYETVHTAKMTEEIIKEWVVQIFRIYVDRRHYLRKEEGEVPYTQQEALRAAYEEVSYVCYGLANCPELVADFVKSRVYKEDPKDRFTKGLEFIKTVAERCATADEQAKKWLFVVQSAVEFNEEEVFEEILKYI